MQGGITFEPAHHHVPACFKPLRTMLADAEPRTSQDVARFGFRAVPFELAGEVVAALLCGADGG